MELYPKFAQSIIAPLWALKEKTPYLKHLKYLEKSQFFSLSQIKQVQWQKFKMLIEHAYENVPYYNQRFKKLRLHPTDIKAFEDLNKIPVLTKEDIRDNNIELRANNIPKSRLIPKKTSGSTGISLNFAVDIDSLFWKQACTIRHDRWANWEIGTRVAAIWGNPEHYKTWKMKLRNFLLDRFTYLDTLKMTELEIDKFYTKIRNKKNVIWFGHAHSLYLFSDYLKEYNLKVQKPKGIISTAMVLHQHERQLIEEVLEGKIFNRYGCEEVSLIASECEEHEGLHMNLDTLLVEVIKNNQPVKPGKKGHIIVTDLTNYGMPFIRYKVGDMGIIKNKTCSCGRALPLFESIVGRVADYIVTPEGNYISGISLTENFAMDLPDIKQIQIVQDKIDHIVLRIVKSKEKNQSLGQQIDSLVNARFGDKMTYDIDYVTSIRQEASGKYRFCISDIESPHKPESKTPDNV